MSSASASLESGSGVCGAPAMTPKELSDYDDLCTAALVDPYLEFRTHKMNLKFRPPSKVQNSKLKEVVLRFMQHQDYEKSWTELFKCEWWSGAVHRKNKVFQVQLKEHVSNLTTYFFY